MPLALSARMAIFSALFALLGRQVTTIIQAIFGWSITALFGKLPTKKQTALSVALGVSVVWPLFVLGCFVPAAASWALAFLPLHKWLGDGALRALWIAFAVALPLAVGGLTHWTSPKAQLRGGVVRTLLGGYPIAVGYFVAFIVTAVTVPVVKVMSAVRKWDDAHVYIQPKEGRYDEVLDALIEACATVRETVTREAIPARMAIATTAMQALANPFVRPTGPKALQRLRGERLELYQYPADLLLRGEPTTVAHVRAAMTRTNLVKCAYLVETPDAQRLQDEIERAEAGEAVPPDAAWIDSALLARKVDSARIPFEEWTALQTCVRRAEQACAKRGDARARTSNRLQEVVSTRGRPALRVV